ncbi:helix-turn-helix transcriptional regulator [Nocardioides maradonensis]
MGTNLIRGHLEGLLLAVLATPGHGYALSERLAARSRGALTVPDGSLYPALQRMERAGLVDSSWAMAEGRRRRVYELTDAGRRHATAAAQEWREFSSAVDRVVGGIA